MPKKVINRAATWPFPIPSTTPDAQEFISEPQPALLAQSLNPREEAISDDDTPLPTDLTESINPRILEE